MNKFNNYAGLRSAMVASIAALMVASTMPAGAQTTAPTPQTTASGIQYITGGIGLDARDQLQSQAGAYKLRMMFAESAGDFLVVDSASVQRGNVEVLNVSNAGPLLFMNLPNGNYTVQARYKGQLRTKSVTVGGRMPDLVLTWPATTAAR